VALIRLTNVTAPSLGAALTVAGRDIPCFYFPDADPATAFGALGINSDVMCGIWLRTDPQYPAAVMARDVKTLCALAKLTDVVVEGEQAAAYVEVLDVMLRGDEVNFHNDVATLVAATNHPAPTRRPTLWCAANGQLRCASTVLRSSQWRSHPEGNELRFN
jgi:hypothetical protein